MLLNPSYHRSTMYLPITSPSSEKMNNSYSKFHFTSFHLLPISRGLIFSGFHFSSVVLVMFCSVGLCEADKLAFLKRPLPIPALAPNILTYKIPGPRERLCQGVMLFLSLHLIWKPVWREACFEDTKILFKSFLSYCLSA